jgi:hypothetical protein
MSSTDLGQSHGMSHDTNPALYPLASALAGELLRLVDARRSRAAPAGIRIVDKLPAPALVRFDQKEIYLHSRYFLSVDVDEVGSPAWYLRYCDVLGTVLHEYGHWCFSPVDFDAFAKSVPKERRSTLVLMEESRVEYRFLYLSEQINSQASYNGPSARVLKAVLRQSLYSTVIRDIQGAGSSEAGSWQQLSQLMLLVQARVWAGSAREDDPRIARIVSTLEPLFEPAQWAKAKEIIEHYFGVGHWGSNMLMSASTKRHVGRLTADWIELMKEVTGDDGEEGSEEGDEDGQPGDKGEEGSQEGDSGDESDEQEQGDPKGESDKPGTQRESAGDEPEQPEQPKKADNDEHSAGKGKGKPKERKTPAKKKLDDLVKEMKEAEQDMDFKEDSDNKEELNEALVEAKATTMLETARRQRTKSKFQQAWH